MHCPTAWGQWAVELLQCTASLPGGSGQRNSCNTLPHCLGAVGSATPAIQCLTAWGQWAVQPLQYSAALLGGSGQWNSCNALPHYPRAVGSATPAMHCLTAWGQWAADLLQCTAPLPGVVLCCVVLCYVVLCCVGFGVVWCAEGANTRRQRPGYLPAGTGKREGCVSQRALCVVWCAPVAESHPFLGRLVAFVLGCPGDILPLCLVTGDHRWCFTCACWGCAKPLGDTDTQECMRCKCYVHATCINDGACLSCARPAPEEVADPRSEQRPFHASWQSGRPWLKYEDRMMHCAACRAHPQLGAQPEWISGIKNCKWDKIKKHQQSGCHAVSLALWNQLVS